MPPSSPPTVTRFAPSPTGHLHIGGARTALFCWAFARRTGGSFLLRIEDTDQARSSEASALGILADLAWLGIGWDEGPDFVAPGSHSGSPSTLGNVGGSSRKYGGDPRGVGPFYQSQRLGLYEEHFARLIDEGKAYAAFETPEELDAKRKEAIGAKRQYRYDRASLAIPASERAARVKAGEPHVVRFMTPDEEIVVRDEVLGEVRIAPGEVDDFVIRKADGFPTYHFGVVVDDALMGVTHVLRGQEHLNNTPRHVLLQKALGFPTPVFAHMPLIFNEAGAKMSKRERDQTARKACVERGVGASPSPFVPEDVFQGWIKDKTRQLETEQLEHLAGAMRLTLPEVSVDDFRRAGYLPEVITNFIALLGWSPPAEAGENIEKFDLDFLAKWFDVSRIGKTNARFDRKKLLAFNTDAVNAMSDADFALRWRAWCADYEPRLAALDEASFALLGAALRPRSKTFAEAAEGASFALLADDGVVYDEKSVDKVLRKSEGEGLRVLRELRDRIDAAPEPFDAPSAHALVEAYAADSGLGMGKIAQPLRVALTGGTVSPPIDATLAILGKARVLARIDRCLKTHA